MLKKITILITLVLLVVACQSTAVLSPEEIAATIVAGTAAAAPTDTPIPTSTPLPTETIMPSPLPPTETPLPSPTAGPVLFKDDFSVESDAWGSCDKCEWKNGALLFGPFPPVGDSLEQLHYVLCEACGEHTYFRVTVDVMFAEGQAGDRIFGLVVGLTADKVLSAVGISPFKIAGFEIYDYRARKWKVPVFDFYSAIKPGTATNRIEVQVKPTVTSGLSDYYVFVNGKQIFTLLNQVSNPARVGLYLEWHSVGALYDNFEYEEIIP